MRIEYQCYVFLPKLETWKLGCELTWWQGDRRTRGWSGRWSPSGAGMTTDAWRTSGSSWLWREGSTFVFKLQTRSFVLSIGCVPMEAPEDSPESVLQIRLVRMRREHRAAAATGDTLLPAMLPTSVYVAALKESESLSLRLMECGAI